MRMTALALCCAIGVLVLGGCQSASTNNGIAQALPHLPDNPDPTKRYCKVWVPPKSW